MTGTASLPKERCESQTVTPKQVTTLVGLEDDVRTASTQLGLLGSEYRSNVMRVLCDYELHLAPQRRIIYSSEQKRKDIEREIVWQEHAIMCQNRRASTIPLPLVEVQAIEKELMVPVHKSLEQSYALLEAVTREDLTTLREYTCPPTQVLTTMEMVMQVRGEEDFSWSNLQVVLSEGYFFSFFVSRAQYLLHRPLPGEVLEQLTQFCFLPENSPELLSVISVPLGALGHWLHSVRSYYKVKDIIARATEAIPVEERHKTVNRLRHELQQVKEDALAARDQLNKLKEQLGRQVVSVRHEYDDTMCTLHEVLEKKTEDFIKVLAGESLTTEDGEVCPSATGDQVAEEGQ
ncbi:hypothetical protein TRVL_03088 [Trypanosoma vivax]|nr:hypothetical protein TRVL_03088 [Trypanosoma vivax]